VRTPGTNRYRCPVCNGRNILPIAYGFPTHEAREQADRDEIALGGCLVGPDNPTRLCKDCGHRWGRLGPRGWND